MNNNEERIEVTEEFRFGHTNTNFLMEFGSKVDMNKAHEVMKNAISNITYDFDYLNIYRPLWIQDLGDCCENDKFEIESTLEYNEFKDYIPTMCEALAKAMPEIEFSGCANYDDLRCFSVINIDFKYSNGILTINSIEYDDDTGYFCPECGEWIDAPYVDFDDDEIECDNCEKTIKVKDLKFVDGYKETKEIKIK